MKQRVKERMNERRKECVKEGERKERRLVGGWNRRRYIVRAVQQIQIHVLYKRQRVLSLMQKAWEMKMEVRFYRVQEGKKNIWKVKA